MKKAILAVPIALCVIFALYPILEIIALFIKPEFLLYSELVFAIVQAVIAAGALGAVIYFKLEFDKLGQAFGIWALPLAMLNAFCFIINGLSICWIFALISAGCVFYIYLKFIPDSTQRAVSAVFSVLLAFVLGFSMIWNLVSPIFSSKTVIREIESNNGEYIAVLGTSKSLFGTKTVIEIKKSEPEIGLIIGGYFKKPITVFEGEEHVALNAKISWDELNDDVIIVNGTEITVSFN